MRYGKERTEGDDGEVRSRRGDYRGENGTEPQNWSKENGGVPPT